MDTSELFALAIRVDPTIQPSEDVRCRAAACVDAAIAVSRPRRRLRRSVLIPALAALAFAVAFTAADAFRLHLFASGQEPPAPVGVSDEFRLMHLGLDLSTVAAAGTFPSPDGSITVYLARSANSQAVATVYTTSAGSVITGMGYEPNPGAGPPAQLALSSNCMFAYLVGGDRCAAGRQPVDVVAMAVDGRVIDHGDPQIAPGC